MRASVTAVRHDILFHTRGGIYEILMNEFVSPLHACNKCQVGYLECVLDHGVAWTHRPGGEEVLNNEELFKLYRV